MKGRFTIIFFLVLATCAAAQDRFKQNALYVEFGGAGLVSSINYERQLASTPGWGIRVGAGLYNFRPATFTVPVGINYLFQKHSHGILDVGFTATWSQADVTLYTIVDHRREIVKPSNGYINYIPTIGYRIHTRRNYLGRLNFAPVINHNGFIPYIGVSFGKLF